MFENASSDDNVCSQPERYRVCSLVVLGKSSNDRSSSRSEAKKDGLTSLMAIIEKSLGRSVCLGGESVSGRTVLEQRKQS